MATNFSSPKVGVDEVRKGPPSLGGKAVTVGGFMGVASRGPVNTPTKVLSYPEAVQVFGDKMDTSVSYLMWDVDLFFRNGGGACWISRISATGIAAADENLLNATPATASPIVASSMGVWANGTTVQSTRKSVRAGTLTTGATLGIGAITSLLLSTGAGRIRKGDLVLVSASGGGQTFALTAIVTSVIGNTIYFVSSTPVTTGVVTITTSAVDILLFDMVVRDVDGNITGNYPNLRVSPLSENFIDTVINGAFRGPVTSTWNQLLNVAGFDSRPSDQTITLSGGVDGAVSDANYIGTGFGSGLGLNAFDYNSDFDMLSIPGVLDTTPLARTYAVVKALLNYAETRKSFVAIISVPKSVSRSAALTYVGSELNTYTTMAEGPWMPWVKVLHPDTGLVTIVPITGARQGAIARTHLSRGNAKAAGGSEDGVILGILGLETDIQEIDYDVLYPARINCAQSQTGAGTYFNGNITLDPTGEIIESGIRFYLLLLAKSLKSGLSWTKFEFNTPTTRARVVRNVASRLRSDWQKGQLDGKNENDAYFVVCDESNNDPTVRAARRLNIQIGVNVAHAAEFVSVTLEMDTRALDATLATAGT